MAIMQVPTILFDMKTAFEQYILSGDDKIIAHYTLE